MQATGHIIAAYQDPKTGRLDKVMEKKNLILFEGADIMAALLGGKPGYAISHMYFQFKNSVSSPIISNPLTRSNGREDFDAMTGALSEDYLRVPLLTDSRLVKIPDDTEDYDQNGVWFTGTSAASETMTGETVGATPFQSTSPYSWVYALALVAAPVPGNPSQDKIFSRVNLSAPLQLPTGKHLVFFWLIRFQ